MTEMERVLEARLDLCFHAFVGTLDEFLETCDLFTALVALSEEAREQDAMAFIL